MIVRELITKLGFKTDEAKLQKANRGFDNLKKNMLLIGGAAVGAAAAINKAIQPAVQLQDALRDALILTGKTGDEFKKLDKDMTDAAQDLSDELGVSAQEVAEGFYQVLSTGAVAMSPQFDAVAKTAIKFGKTIGLSVSESVERVNDTLNAFGLAATDAEHVADVFFNTSKMAALTVPQLADAMREAAPAARTVGVSLEETSAILATLAQQGIKGTLAGTAFRMMMLKLAKPAKEGQRALKKMRVEVFKSDGTMRNVIDVLKDMQKATAKMSDQNKAAALKAIVGEEAFAKLSAILNSNLETTREWSKANREAAGTLDLAFTQRMDTAKRQTTALWESLKNLMAEGVQPFLQQITDTVREVSDVVKIFREWIEQNEQLIDTLSTIYEWIQKFNIVGRMLKAPFEIIKGIAGKLKIPEVVMPEMPVPEMAVPGAPGQPPLMAAAAAAGPAGVLPMTAAAAMPAVTTQNVDKRQQNRVSINVEVKAPLDADARQLGQLVGDVVDERLGGVFKGAQEATD